MATLIRPDHAAMAMVHPDLLGGTRQRLVVSYWSGGVSVTCVPGTSSAPRSHGVRILVVRCCGRYRPSKSPPPVALAAEGSPAGAPMPRLVVVHGASAFAGAGNGVPEQRTPRSTAGEAVCRW